MNKLETKANVPKLSTRLNYPIIYKYFTIIIINMRYSNCSNKPLLYEVVLTKYPTVFVLMCECHMLKWG